jgi:hypothetical protein
MEETLRENLLTLGAQYTAASGRISLAAIGKLALNDNTVFSRLQARETGFNVRTYDRLVRWFSANWPPMEPWPFYIERLGVSDTDETAS